MELILVVIISAGMAENSQNGVSRSLMLKIVMVGGRYVANRDVLMLRTCVVVCNAPLAPQGSYLLTKQRPVDQLRQLLLTSGTDSGDVKAFFKLHGVRHACPCHGPIHNLFPITCNNKKPTATVQF